MKSDNTSEGNPQAVRRCAGARSLVRTEGSLPLSPWQRGEVR